MQPRDDATTRPDFAAESSGPPGRRPDAAGADPAPTLPRSAAAARRAGLGPLRHVVSTGSTNDDLAGEARAGRTGPAVLVADHQTAGRGRLGRRWIDSGGPGGDCEAALLVSLRLPGPVETASGRVAAVSAAALAAAAEALGEATASVRAKWPNDLVIESEHLSGKLAGVLSEIVVAEPPAVVVGLGLNLGPVPGAPSSASLAEAGAAVARDDLLARIIGILPGYLADPAGARAALRSASATVGRAVRVERAGGAPVTGTARDIDESGRLIVVADGEEHRIDAGDVVHLRPF